jgi:hypothetical protein
MTNIIRRRKMPNGNGRPWYRDPRIVISIVAIVVTIIIWLWPNNSPPDFSISVSPMQGSVQPGGGIRTTITVKGIHGYEHPVSLSASEQPSGVVATFAPQIGKPAPTFTSNVMINVGSNVPASDYTVIIKGTGADGKEHACKYILTIKPTTVTPTSPPTPSPTPSVKAYEVKITYPYDDDTVEIREMVRGTSQKIPEGQAIWIMVYPHVVGRYYPQDNPVDVQANGDWTSLIYIGIEEDVNRKFDIIAVLADKRAQDAFNAYFTKAKDTNTWPGLERLLEGATIYDRITVMRK